MVPGMLPSALELGVYGLFAVALVVVVGVPMLGVTLLVARWGRLGTQFGLLRRRLGMSRPLGWALVLLAVGGFLAPFAAGSPPSEGGGEFWFVLAGVTYVAGVLAGGWALARRDLQRLVASTDPGDTGGLRQPGDHVELEGEVTAEPPLTAPVTGEDAAAYRYRVDERRWMGRTDGWVPMAHGREATGFVVDDGSGPARVDPEGARLDLHDPDVLRVEGDEALPDPAAAFVAEVDGVDADDHLKLTEWRLAPADHAYVLGVAVDRPSADAHARTAIGDGDGPFVVADRSEAALQRRLRSLVVYGGPGGAVAAIAGLAGMLWAAGGL
jgi:hypothetical protein